MSASTARQAAGSTLALYTAISRMQIRAGHLATIRMSARVRYERAFPQRGAGHVGEGKCARVRVSYLIHANGLRKRN